MDHLVVAQQGRYCPQRKQGKQAPADPRSGVKAGSDWGAVGPPILWALLPLQLLRYDTVIPGIWAKKCDVLEEKLNVIGRGVKVLMRRELR
ncbi:hypothetical protein NDU88_006267 [Pleurodeles waltl]|uniref:Uncharacterized protein n=1 Tax=Pleurodeles waltl TaxID=8319 RepID=A0AAV7MZ19_PLEWA|nr:hypothetical protein NDU88_006267 [Pleurodeles waltl]